MRRTCRPDSGSVDTRDAHKTGSVQSAGCRALFQRTGINRGNAGSTLNRGTPEGRLRELMQCRTLDYAVSEMKISRLLKIVCIKIARELVNFPWFGVTND